MSQEKYLGKIVAVRTAQGELVALGHCVGYTDQPTLNVNGLDGKQTHWIAELCEVIEMKEDAATVIADAAFHRVFPDYEKRRPLDENPPSGERQYETEDGTQQV